MDKIIEIEVDEEVNLSMSEVIKHLCDELETIQKDIYTLCDETDSDTSKRLKELLNHFENLDASCYKLKEINHLLKNVI